jgi:hypothetical protein
VADKESTAGNVAAASSAVVGALLKHDLCKAVHNSHDHLLAIVVAIVHDVLLS